MKDVIPTTMEQLLLPTLLSTHNLYVTIRLPMGLPVALRLAQLRSTRHPVASRGPALTVHTKPH